MYINQSQVSLLVGRHVSTVFEFFHTAHSTCVHPQHTKLTVEHLYPISLGKEPQVGAVRGKPPGKACSSSRGGGTREEQHHREGSSSSSREESGEGNTTTGKGQLLLQERRGQRFRQS